MGKRPKFKLKLDQHLSCFNSNYPFCTCGREVSFDQWNFQFASHSLLDFRAKSPFLSKEPQITDGMTYFAIYNK